MSCQGFFFLPPFFAQVVWLELFYWAASRFLLCHLNTGGSRCAGRQAQSPSHCSLGRGLGWRRVWGGGPRRAHRWGGVCFRLERHSRRSQIPAGWPRKLSSLRGWFGPTTGGSRNWWRKLIGTGWHGLDLRLGFHQGVEAASVSYTKKPIQSRVESNLLARRQPL